MINQIKKIYRIFIVIILIIFSLVVPSIALEVATHRAINEYVADKSTNLNNFSLHKYLQQQLGIQNGSEEYFNSKKVFKWLGDGGVNEDDGTRFRNHFLNPINDKGLGDYYKSAVDWATLSLSEQTFSWNDVRFYYYKALTVSSKTAKERNFAKTFRGLGQIMHLVQDMSVPAHTRNDAHPTIWLVAEGDPYEKWAEKYITKDTPFSTTYPAYDYKQYNTAYFLIPQLFDSGQYKYIENKLDPNITVSSNIGLAEYTNANFLSSDTIFENFDYPSYKPGISMSENPTTIEGNRVLYLKKIGEGETINRFARAGRFFEKLPAEYKDLDLTIKDDNIHQDYANLLIPRAMGYSSQALNYFFRGQMKVKDMPVFNDQNNLLKELHVEVRNTTPTKETMVGDNNSSCFSLSWHYTPVGGSSDIYGSYPYCVYLDKPLPYGLDTDGNDVDNDTYTTTIIFDELDQIPNVPAISKTDYPDVEFTLTYLGTLGDEKMPPSNVPGQVTIAGAVIGKVFKPAESILFDEEWMTIPKGDNLVWSISSDSSGNAVDTTFINNFFYCPDTQHYTLYGCPSGCPSPFTNPQGKSTDTIFTENGGNLLMTNTANVIPGCDPSMDNRPGQGNIVMIGSDIGHYNCQGQYVTSGNSFNPVDSTNNFIFPIKINKNSYIQFSLDEMSIIPAPPESNSAQAYQILEFQFNHGYVLQFVAGDEGFYNSNPYVGYFSFDLGYLIVGNIYEYFAEWGFPTPPSDLQLISIKIAQQALWNLPCNEAYTQKISVDCIRVGEIKAKE